MTKVLCFGSLNIDHTYKVKHMVAQGETLTADAVSTQAGGKGLNQSIALSRAGACVYHAGAIGEDGLFLKELLEENGINTDCVRVLAGMATGHAIIQNDLSGDNCIILYSGANRCISDEMVEESLKEFGEDDCLVLQNEINNLKGILATAKAKGMITVLNPSPMDERVLELDPELIDILILNEVEGEQILSHFGEKTGDFDKMATGLCKICPRARVVLTLGTKGSIYTDGSEVIRQGCYPVKAVDTTAAGDTFLGFFIAGLVSGKTVAEALDRAAKASSVAVTRPGAADSIPFENEIQ